MASSGGLLSVDSVDSKRSLHELEGGSDDEAETKVEAVAGPKNVAQIREAQAMAQGTGDDTAGVGMGTSTGEGEGASEQKRNKSVSFSGDDGNDAPTTGGSVAVAKGSSLSALSASYTDGADGTGE